MSTLRVKARIRPYGFAVPAGEQMSLAIQQTETAVGDHGYNDSDRFVVKELRQAPNEGTLRTFQC